MRLNQFLLLVTLTCIACDSIVASSKDLIQVKTLNANSPRERTDGIHRNLREGVVEANIADVEERIFSPKISGGVFDGLMANLQKVAKLPTEKSAAFMKLMKRLYQSLISRFAKAKLSKMNKKNMPHSTKTLSEGKKTTSSPTEIENPGAIVKVSPVESTPKTASTADSSPKTALTVDSSPETASTALTHTGNGNKETAIVPYDSRKGSL
ncbi:unnamed protein product [Peronospora farinosa]|uniref:RxLR effector protein n=1 Tax=Peronospora farinosa TaxID=134698 RepID=A0AAV0USB7_9STRA|nr:unnamed protein product [Peronospora farinosa]